MQGVAIDRPAYLSVVELSDLPIRMNFPEESEIPPELNRYIDETLNLGRELREGLDFEPF